MRRYLLILVLVASSYIGSAQDYGYVSAVALSRDEKTMASGGWDHHVRIWNLQKGSVLKQIRFEHTIEGLSYNPDDTQLAVAEGPNVHIINTSTGETQQKIEGHDFSEVSEVIFTPDGKYLLTGSKDNTVKVWDAKTWKELKTFKHPAFVTALAVSGDSKYLASATRTNVVKIWDLTTMKAGKSFTLDGNKYVGSYTIAFSPDNKTIIVGGQCPTALFNVKTGALVKQLNELGTAGVAYSADGSRFITRAKNTLFVKDSTDNEILNFPVQENGVSDNCTILTKDGIVITGGSNQVNMYNVSDGRLIGEYIHSTAQNNSYRLFDTRKDVALYVFEYGSDFHFKVVNKSGVDVYVSVNMIFECGSVGSYQTVPATKNMSVMAGATRSAEDENNDDYIQEGCRNNTLAKKIVNWSIQ